MTVDYAKITVAELRQMVLKETEGILTEEDVNKKKKKDLVKLYQEITHEEPEEAFIVEEYEDESNEELQQSFPQHDIPDYTSEEWEGYVMSLFSEEELVGEEKRPTAPGLRRVAELALGDVIFSGAVDTKVLLDGEVGRAAVTYEVRIAWNPIKNTMDFGSSYKERVYRGFASSWSGNTNDDVAIYPEATAETRAEVRALRKALGLRKVAHEETSKKTLQDRKDIQADWEANESIKDTQKTLILTVCKRAGKDENELASELFGVSSLDELTRQQASDLIRELHEREKKNETIVHDQERKNDG